MDRAGSCWVLACLLLPLGCGDEGGARADTPRPAEIRAELLAGDGSRALHLARAALADSGPQAELHLLASEACLQLERYSEACEHAAQGSDLSPPEDLLCELQWAEGKARLGLYKELRSDVEWRRANALLEQATRAGSRRLAAAYALVVMHADPSLGNPERLQRFARLVIELDPEGEEAGKVRAIAAERGVEL